MSSVKKLLLALPFVVAATATAQAEMVIGAAISTTGPIAALGALQKNAYEMLPKEIGGVPVKLIIMDDGGDPRVAVQNVRKLIEEHKADVILGSAATPVAMATAAIAEQAKTPHISLAPIPTQPYRFSATAAIPVMIEGIVLHMKKKGYKTVGFIGFSDALGDELFRHLSQQCEAAGIKVVANERYARADTSVAGQTLKVLGANPDAVMVGGSGTPAALPHMALVERGYKGQIYHSHATAVPDFLRVGGKLVEGAIIPTGPILVAASLPDSNPIKKPALEFIKAYEAKHGPNTTTYFAASAYDGAAWLKVAVPVALKKGKPGTEAFRVALRDALENLKEVVGTTTISTLSPKDHIGADGRSRILVQVKDGKFVFLE
ncbi:MAG: ABC transporter substrate-binding protein [Alphaproteobacteria bacterium]